MLGTGLPGLGTEHLPGALCSGNEIEIPELDPEDMPQPETMRANLMGKTEAEDDEPVGAEESEELEQAADEAFSMSEDDLSFGADEDNAEADDDFSLSDENAEDLEDFSVADLSDLDLDDDI